MNVLDLFPKEITQATDPDPGSLLIFGDPKQGKTTLAAKLSVEKNFLLLDFEPDGASYVTAIKVNIYQIAKTFNLSRGQALLTYINQLIRIKNMTPEEREAKKLPYYNGIIIDNISVLEDIAHEIALEEFLLTEKGIGMATAKAQKGLKLTSLYDDLDRGLGYGIVRTKFLEIKSLIEQAAPHVVYIGHTKLKKKPDPITGEEKEVPIKLIDLSGQLSRIMAQYVSAIGYVYLSDSENGTEVHWTFKGYDEGQVSASRVPRISGYAGVADWNLIYKNI
jgi:hypothetical protein